MLDCHALCGLPSGGLSGGRLRNTGILIILHTTISGVSLFALGISLAIPAGAQEVPADPQEEPEFTEIVVTAPRIRGTVDTDVPPVLELDAEEIASYGADSITDLVEQLSPQTSSGRGRGSGRPVFLVNGQRIGSFREFRRYPPEAIQKVEVFPEEVALQYGYPADQRVINFILKDNFTSKEVEAEYAGPTAGGSANGELEASTLLISGPRRINFGFEYNTQSLLTEDERGIIQTDIGRPTVLGDPDPALYRSLRPDSESYELEASLNSGLGEGADAGTYSINAALERNLSRSLSGLDIVTLTDPDGATAVRALDANPLERYRVANTYSAGGSFAKPLGDWDLNVTLDGSHVESWTKVDRRRDAAALRELVAAGELALDAPLPPVGSAGVDRAASQVSTISSLATLRGNPVLLPAGEVNLTFDAGYAWNRIASTDTRTDLGTTVLKRGDLSAGINAGIPIASAREGFLSPLGELGLNLAVGVDELSDFGTLTDYTLGLNWEPADRLSLQASYIVRDAAPGLSQLGDPIVVEDNVAIFDFNRNESVLATVVTGGNPSLIAETQRDFKLAANYEVDLFERSNIIFEYFDNNSSDVTENFPLLTPQIEAAFPDRVTRGPDGRLQVVDLRPVTFAERNSSRVRYGFNLFGRVGREQEEVEPRGQRGQGEAAEGASAQSRGSPGGMPGGFDPERFAAMRQALCADPASAPDISVLPERFQERLRGPDRQVDPERLAQARARLCEASPGGEGQQGGGFDPERLAQIRQAICAPVQGNALPDLSSLPEAMLARLRGPDGEIDPERLAQLRERICQAESVSEGGQKAGQENRGGGEGRGRGGRGGRGGGGGRFGGGDDGQGRWNVALYHTVELENEALVAEGGPLLDLLDGGALGSGGISRHRVELEGGVFHKGLGLRLSANYASGTRVDGSGLPGSTDLFFGDLATVDARIFVNLEEQEWLTGDEPGFWKGARLSLRADNVFDTRQRVTDAAGIVPLRYQPGLIDPVGRFVEVEFRKLF